MSTKETLKQYMTQEILNGHGKVDLKDDDELLLSGLIDSLGVVRLIAFIEEHLGLHVPPEDVIIENFQSLQAMSDYLETRQVA